MFARKIISLTTIATLFLTLAIGNEAEAQRKKKGKPACGIMYLPLVEGNEWVYEATSAPEPPKTEDEKKFLAGLAKQAPPHPRVIEIKVLSVKTDGGATEIKLSEKTITHVKGQEIQVETTLRCTPNSLHVDPSSFFFAAEPGGALMMKLSDVKRVGEHMPGRRGFRRNATWILELSGKLARSATEKTGASLTSGRIEVESKYTVRAKQHVATMDKTVYNAITVWFELSGRAHVEPEMKSPSEMPLGVPGTFWFANKVGLIRAKNRVGQWFLLKSMTLN